MINFINILTIFLCGALNFVGGYSYHNARRFIMPLIIAIIVAINIKSFFAIGCLLSVPLLCIGYGEKSILWKIFNDFWARFIWSMLVAIGFTVILLFKCFLPIHVWLLYISICGVLGAALRNINQVFGDYILGILFSSFIFFLR